VATDGWTHNCCLAVACARRSSGFSIIWPMPTCSAASMACVAKMRIWGVCAERSTVLLVPIDGAASAEEYCKRRTERQQQRCQPEREMGQEANGGGDSARVREWYKGVGTTSPPAHGPAHVQTGPQCAAAASEPESRPAPASAEHEKQGRSAERRRGTDLVEVNCTEAGAAGTGRGRGVVHGVRRRALTDLH
jgi:hypothetical protein